MDISFINENEDLRDEIQGIKNSILIILDEVHNSRNYLNKHFQNSMVNYFLRNLNFPFLSETEPRYTCSKIMNNIILQKYINSEGAIYIRLMKGYLIEIEKQGKMQPYRETLQQMIMQQTQCSRYDTNNLKKQNIVQNLRENKEYQSEMWKKAFSLFVMFHSYNQNIKGIFEIWNILFPDDQIIRKRKQNINHVIVIPNYIGYAQKLNGEHQVIQEQQEEKLELTQ